MTKKISPKSLQNLKSDSKAPQFSGDYARECQKRAVAKRMENREKYFAREAAKDEILKELIKQGKIEETIRKASPKEIIELIKAILPPDKQTQELIGNLGIQKVFVTPEEVQEADKLIEDTFNEQ